MANRRNIGLALQAAGDSLGQYFALQNRQHQQQQLHDDTIENEGQRQEAGQDNQFFQDLVNGRMSPSVIQALIASKVSPSYKGQKLDLSKFLPSQDQTGGQLSKEIEQMHDPSSLTEEGIQNQWRAAGQPTGSSQLTLGPMKGGGVPGADPSNGGSPDQATLPSQDITSQQVIPDALKRVLAERQAKVAALQAKEGDEGTWEEVTNPDGSKHKVFISKPSAAQYAPGGNTLSTGLSASQQGTNEAAKFIASKSPDVLRVEGKEEGIKAGASASASETARRNNTAPGEYTLPDGTVVFAASDGRGGMKMVNTPDELAGAVKGGPKTVPASVATSNALGNSAEINGVRVLTELKNAGLDKDNDFASPRWTQWLISKVGAKPGDIPEDVNQRANYVKAAMMRVLLQGRPNKALMDWYSAHIPDASYQSPALLVGQLEKAMDENSTYRQNIKQSYPSLPEPVGGMTFKDYMTLKGQHQQSLKPQTQDFLKQLGLGGVE